MLVYIPIPNDPIGRKTSQDIISPRGLNSRQSNGLLGVPNQRYSRALSMNKIMSPISPG